MDTNSTITQQVTTILVAMQQQGIQDAVISPGSRSTPVALLLAQLADEHHLNLYVDVDERSAAFFALGLIKQLNRPVLLVCTSGTAAANFYPAICEAKISHLPLIVLTTDRPPELTNIGAPQALDQDHFYGNQVKQFCQLPLASNNADELDYVRLTVQRLVVAAQTSPCGPIHFNLPLRKPLMPQLPANFQTTSQSKIHFEPQVSSLDQSVLERIHHSLQGKRGLIIAGPNWINDDFTTMGQWAVRSSWPILADPLSQLRGKYSSVVISNYDLFVSLPEIMDKLKPEVIIRTGATVVSAALTSWLKSLHIPIYYLDPNQELNDASRTATHIIPTTAAAFFNDLATTPVANWLSNWQAVQSLVNQQLSLPDSTQDLCEPLVPIMLSKMLPSPSQLFVSNSMPIRDVDTYFSTTSPNISIYCNRGANGIDGVISSALGMSVRSKQSNFLLIGDLAFFHDMNGLMMATRYHIQLRIIVINNNGGGIFSFLPQAGASDFEDLFGTPQNLNIQAVAQLYDCAYQKVTTVAQLTSALKPPIKGLEIIEVITSRRKNVSQHNHLQQHIQKALLREFANDHYTK